MRLLNCRKILDGPSPSDAIEIFYDERFTPRYAILSHTWGKEEVSLQDLEKPHVSLKRCFEKIRKCCKQALNDDLDYAWVDTCCIDKTSSAELSEAINSMFRWYSKAEVCYAFLEDIDFEETLGAGESIDLSTSRWFTRGWTLQELLAPYNVVFFSSSWQEIGRKQNIGKHLSQITNIEREYLVDESRSQTGKAARELGFASIAQKMSWAARRTTTREEDRAYSLLGIFEVNMPLIYGEGSRAFKRLQEELLKQCHDESIFAWSAQTSSFTPLNADFTICGMFAESPVQFKNAGNIVPFKAQSSVKAPTMTPGGLQIYSEYRLDAEHHRWPIRVRHHGHVLLRCHKEGDLHNVVAVPLRQIADTMSYWRDISPVTFLPPSSNDQPPIPIHVRGNAHRLSSQEINSYIELRYPSDVSSCLIWVDQLPRGFYLDQSIESSSFIFKGSLDLEFILGALNLGESDYVVLCINDGQRIALKFTKCYSRTPFARLCPFARPKGHMRCLATRIKREMSTSSIRNSHELKWESEPYLPGHGAIIIDIRPHVTMGLRVLALRIHTGTRFRRWCLVLRNSFTASIFYWTGTRERLLFFRAVSIFIAALVTLVLFLL